MAVLEKGSLPLDLGFVSSGGDLSDEGRQCAWKPAKQYKLVPLG
jgi:hypothetical protein